MSRLITIITATYNAAEHLPALITSLRDQTFKDFAWIVVDGNSDDETMSIIEKNMDIVTLFIRGPDFGIYDALNKAITRTNTPYYLVVGSDDKLHSKSIELYRQAAINSHADIVSACVETSNFGILRPGRGQAWRFGHLAYVSQHAVGSLIKTSLHKRIGLYSKFYPIAADRHFLLNAIINYNCVVYCDNFMAGIYSCKGMSSSRYYEALLDIFKVDYVLSKNRLRTSFFSLLKYIVNMRYF